MCTLIRNRNYISFSLVVVGLVLKVTSIKHKQTRVLLVRQTKLPPNLNAICFTLFSQLQQHTSSGQL